MRLNLLGQAIGRGHVNGVLLPAHPGGIGTEYCWFEDNVPIFAAGSTIEKFEQGEWRKVANQGANWLRAGKGRWFAIPGNGDLAPCDVDPYTGTALLTQYSLGRNLILVPMVGAPINISTGVLGTDAVAFRNARLRNNWLLYQSDGVWTLSKNGVPISIVPRVENVDYAVPVPIADRVLLLERAHGRLSLRYPNTTLGWLVDPSADPYGLVAADGIEVGGLACVTWSDKQSEAADTFRVTDVILSDNTRVDLNVLVFPPVESIPLIDRDFGVLCYTFNDAKGIGHITLPVRPTKTLFDQQIVLPSDRPDLAEGNDLWAVYAGENAGLSYEDAIKQARPLGDDLLLGLLAYKEGYPLPTSSQIKDHDVAGCQLIRGPAESVASFKARCREFTGDWPSIHLVDTELRACETFHAACEIVDEGFWMGFSLFAIGRPGVPTHVLAPRVERFLSGITGVPAARVIEPEEPVEPAEDLMRIFMYDPKKVADDKGYVKYEDAEGTKPGQCLGTKVAVPGASDGGFGIRKKNGKVRALNPNGDWEERDNVGGDVSKPGASWELFYPTRPGGMSAPRGAVSYYFETSEQV